MSLKPRRVDFDSIWTTLLETIKGVITCGKVPRAIWNDRFSDVYKLCTALPEPLGDRLYQETKNFLESYVKTLHTKVTQSEMDLLGIYHRHWEEYCRGAGYLNQLYGWVELFKFQKYTDADINYGGFTVDMGDHMLEIGSNVIHLFRDRLGSSVNQAVVHGVIISLVDVENYKKKMAMQLYEEMFETPFLKETGNFYRSEASRLKSDCTCSEYMEKVIQRLDTENLRSRRFLHGSSYDKVTQECQQRLVADHLQFLHAECHEMVQLEKCKDLTNMYKLLKPIQGGLGLLVQEMEDHIRCTGLEAIKNLKGENIQVLFVDSMLEVHSHFTEVIQKVFSNDQQFVGALDKACSAVINYKVNPKQPCRSPELLARYCDCLLKKSSKGISESEMDDKLASCITVFKYLDDKDVFQRFYARMLAKRLIYGQSASMDAEEGMINKLKQACGYEFTNKLHRMFTDMSISTDHNCSFQKYLQDKQQELGISFNILVLQAGAWPIGQANIPSFALPWELEHSVRMFDAFYSEKFSGRKLTWMHSFCTGELKFNHLKKPYFVTMGSYNMAIMLQFNQAESLTLQDISAATQLPEKELIRQMQALVEAKIIFTEGEMTTASTFSLNMNYSNKRTKFKITSSVQRDTPQEVESTHSAVDEDRKMYLQAAIVRIMKARRLLKHNLLIQEVITQSATRFSPSVSMIKKCIETLIDKQYLERTASSPDEYNYMA
ncbi:hypothetical protein C0Q70_10016 [Pomacea canaliculata]|uniref:Cullin-2 n=1 Tax=Pomacea canaliculata TaxID=400727 RepID=A0A2T7PBF0_POMCA|nr:hypothetical protein C0Q70_10016 [Pomacea canaliculata]